MKVYKIKNKWVIELEHGIKVISYKSNEPPKLVYDWTTETVDPADDVYVRHGIVIFSYALFQCNKYLCMIKQEFLKHSWSENGRTLCAEWEITPVNPPIFPEIGPDFRLIGNTIVDKETLEQITTLTIIPELSKTNAYL